MKQIYIRFALLVLLILPAVGSLSAQSMIQTSGVPEEIRNDFDLRFSDASGILWFKDSPQYYGARFKWQGKKIQTVYSAVDRQWVQTVEPIGFEEMPDSAQKYLLTRFPEYRHKNPKKVSTRSYGILYEIVMGKDLSAVELAFDMHGKLVREDEVVLENDSSMSDPESGQREDKPKGLKAKLKKLGGK